MRIFDKSFWERIREQPQKGEPPKESLEQEARRLASQLNAIFVQAPLFEPYQGDDNKVQLNNVCIGYIQEVLSTSNGLVTGSEWYEEISTILRKLLEENSKGIEVEYIVKNSRLIKKLYFSLQPQEYWER